MYDEKKIVVCVSGGKDSSAMCLNLMEQGYSSSDYVRIYCDTGWEDQGTYEYLDYLEKTVGPITRLKAEVEVPEGKQAMVQAVETMMGFSSPMVRYIYKYGHFPSSKGQWCTRILKLKPTKKYLDSIETAEPVVLVGIRKEESKRRAQMTSWEYSGFYECDVHRPILDWTEKDVIDIHQRFHLLPNNLYLKGWNRVGCYPCVNARKKELVLLSDTRVKIIAQIEKDLGATFFHIRNITDSSISSVMSWAKTSRGGQQFELFNQIPHTCDKWGLCDFTGGE